MDQKLSGKTHLLVHHVHIRIEENFFHYFLVLEDVIHYRKKSKNPFVSSTANLMSQFLLDHECKEIDIESNPNENDSSEVLKTIK